MIILARKTAEQISYNMSRVRNKNTTIECILRAELEHRGLVSYTQNDKSIFGKPDFVFKTRKIAVFCDSEFWHGYDWAKAKHEIKSRQDFWIPKIEKTMQRDKDVTAYLESKGWVVLRFWGKHIKSNVSDCVEVENK